MRTYQANNWYWWFPSNRWSSHYGTEEGGAWWLHMDLFVSVKAPATAHRSLTYLLVWLDIVVHILHTKYMTKLVLLNISQPYTWTQTPRRAIFYLKFNKHLFFYLTTLHFGGLRMCNGTDPLVTEATNLSLFINQKSNHHHIRHSCISLPLHAARIFEDGWADRGEKKQGIQRDVMAFTEHFIRGKMQHAPGGFTRYHVG